MYVRDAKNRDEAWLLDEIEAMGLDDAAFRSRDYVIAVDEEANHRVGFGRLRIHKREDAPDVVELTGIGVLQEWRDQGVGAHVIERLVDTADANGFDEVYVLTDQREYLEQFGFERTDAEQLPEPLVDRLAEKRERVSEETAPLRIGVTDFEMATRHRQAFKNAQPTSEVESEPGSDIDPEEFGIDPENATYKYDTG